MIPACTNNRTGRLLVYTGALVGNLYLQGVRITTPGRRAFGVAAGTPVYMVGGAPVDREGRLCYDVGAPVVFGTSGLGYSAARRLAVDATNPPNMFANGMGFFNGALCVDIVAALAPPGSFTLSGSTAPGMNFINWTLPVPGAESFEVTKDGLPFKTIYGTATGTFDDHIISSVVYRYRCIAVNNDGSTISTPAFIDLTAL